MDNTLLSTIGATLLAVLSAAPKIFRVLKEWREAAKKDLVVDGLQRTRRTYAAVEDIAKVSGAQRVILFAGHNGGGIPQPSSPFWVSSTYLHATTDELERVISEYQNLKIDAMGIEVLLSCQRNEHVVLKMDDLPDGSMLKKHYRVEGVKHAVLFFVDIIENKFFFVSMARYDDEPFSEDQIVRASLKVNIMRQSMTYRGG